MKALLDRINQGERPSRLQIARLHTGELAADEAARVRQQMAGDPHAEAWWRELDESKRSMPPFDAEIVQKLAFRLQAEQDVAPQRPRARRPVWRWLMAGLSLAAAATLALVLVLPPQGHRTKGDGVDVDFYVLRDGAVHPGLEDQVHLPGDRIQFTYRSSYASTLVLVSVDGNGRVNLYYPAAGDEPVEVVPGERRVLPGSILLDDAPDFDIFLAFFAVDSAKQVVSEVEAVWRQDGVDGLLALGEEPGIDVVFIEKPSQP